jgi:hypothetical protein
MSALLWAIYQPDSSLNLAQRKKARSDMALARQEIMALYKVCKTHMNTLMAHHAFQVPKKAKVEAQLMQMYADMKHVRGYMREVQAVLQKVRRDFGSSMIEDVNFSLAVAAKKWMTKRLLIEAKRGVGPWDCQELIRTFHKEAQSAVDVVEAYAAAGQLTFFSPALPAVPALPSVTPATAPPPPARPPARRHSIP